MVASQLKILTPVGYDRHRRKHKIGIRLRSHPDRKHMVGPHGHAHKSNGDGSPNHYFHLLGCYMFKMVAW